MGVIGKAYSEFSREWLNRLFGELIGLAALWLLVGGIIVHARPAWKWISAWMWLHEGNAFVVAVGATLTGFVLGFALRGLQAVRAGFASKTKPRWPIRLISWLVILAIFAILTVLYQNGLVVFSPPGNAMPLDHASYSGLLDRHFSELASILSFNKEYLAVRSTWWLVMPSFTLFLVLAALVWVGFRCIDVNTFSIQNLYRNRLVRCYLGATNQKDRLANPYSGFDPTDDLELKNFATQRPYLLSNAALNLTQGQDLAWQQRKAASFVFSPRWCGYWLESTETSSISRPDRLGGYVPTESFVHEPRGFGEKSQGIMVGTAMATSGAAVSSQMGFASQGPRAFLLTLLNMRLGRWLPNPAWSQKWAMHSKEALWKLPSPRYGAFCYLSELFGMTNERSKWIYLSDGGHFENLGLYELVRRRCRRIICVDAGADPHRAFGDLGNAVQKCRVDFGVEIEIDTYPLSIDVIDGRSESAFSIGTRSCLKAAQRVFEGSSSTLGLRHP
jgi:hypothetical protein